MRNPNEVGMGLYSATYHFHTNLGDISLCEALFDKSLGVGS